MLAQLSFWTLIGTTLTAGAVAAFNPCGFAMLPAYLGYFLGLDSEDETNTAHNIARAIAVGVTLTLGFVLFFGLIGVLTSTLVSQGDIFEKIPWVTLIFGILLIPLGIAMVFGFEPKLNIPRLQKGGKTRDLPSIFLFGVSYAAVSLSCTAPIFLGTVIGSFTRSSFVEGLGAFFAYALGMGLVITVLTLAMAIFRASVANAFRKVLPYVNKASGVLLVLTGIFLIIYARWELSTFSGTGEIEDGFLVREATNLQATMTNWVNNFGGTRFAIICGLIVAAMVGWASFSSRNKNSSETVESTDQAAETGEKVTTS